MSDIVYLDCFALVGRRVPRDANEVWTTEDLLDEMQHCDVRGALVTHEMARTYDPAFGNEQLQQEVAKSERLWPCWVLMPAVLDEMPAAEQVVEGMLARGVPAAKICPTRHTYHPVRDTEDICRALQEAGLPLFIDWPGIGVDGLALVEDICRAFPDLAVVLQGCSWTQYRTLAGVMSRCPNLHTEFSSMQGNYALEVLGELCGFQRLLFGSETLVKSLGAARSFVDYAELTDEQRRLIAGGNLARLLKLPQPPPPYPPCDREPLLARAQAGQPLDNIVVIDAHAHWLQDGAKGAGYTMPRGDADHMVPRIKRLGIDKVVTASWLGIWGFYDCGNETTVQMIQRYPDIIVGYATLDPSDPNFERDIEYWHLEKGLKGLKPYFPRYQIPYDDERYLPWWEFANEYHLFALLHASSNFNAEVRNLATRFPNVSFLLAHSGGSFPLARDRIKLARELPNVFLEITLTPVCHRIIELLVEGAGADRVVFGTDAPMRDPIPQFGWVVYSRLTTEQKRKVLGENMLRILDRCRL